jgi:hypothetical protein
MNETRSTRITPYLTVSGVVLTVESLAVVLIQTFLFPLESYWVTIAAGLAVYAGVDVWLTVYRGRPDIFTALDNGDIRLRDTLWLIAGPICITLILALVTRLPLVNLLPVMVLACLLHSGLTAAASSTLNAWRNNPLFPPDRKTTAWAVSLLVVTIAYTLAYFSHKTYPAVNPLLEGSPVTRGIWFTVPVAKSETYPLGQARLEDSIVDDLGRPFFAALGQSLGLVQRCAIPGPDLINYVQISPDPNVQPKFRTNVDTLCPEWIQTLPGYFWRIGLLGLFFLSLVIGRVVIRHPVDFALVALLLLFGWFIWPASERVRVGNVPVLIMGMPWIGLIFPVIRRNSSALAVLWGIGAGLIFSLAGLVRSPVGFSLIVTAVLAILLAGWRQKKAFLPLLALTALLLGNTILPAVMNGLFTYRDEKLQITAPKTSPREHGSGFALLGGVGGKDLTPENFGAPLYDNALDIAFADVPIWLTVYDENPLINFTQHSYELVLKTSERVFLRYIAGHPLEFLWVLGQKLLDYSRVMFLPLLGLVLFVTLVLRRYAKFKPSSRMGVNVTGARETVSMFVILALVASIPAVLTSMDYGENLFLPAAVIFFTGIFALFITFKSILLKRRR